MSQLRDRTQTPHRQHSSGRVIRPSQRPVPDNTQHSQQTDIRTPGGNRIRNPCKKEVSAQRLRTRSVWDRHITIEHDLLHGISELSLMSLFLCLCRYYATGVLLTFMGLPIIHSFIQSIKRHYLPLV